MLDNKGMYQGYSVEGNAELKITPDKVKENTAIMGPSSACVPEMCPPIYECPQERCVHREIIHEVPHVQPINTRIINHHIYRHTYTPCYTCTEENEVCNVNACGPRFM